MNRTVAARIASRFGPSGHSRLARLGVWGFAFFALKGVAWLLVPLIAVVLA
jgi:hypothetical protein